jgi:hypothetical protein
MSFMSDISQMIRDDHESALCDCYCEMQSAQDYRTVYYTAFSEFLNSGLLRPDDWDYLVNLFLRTDWSSEDEVHVI